jgi:Protein of unknown function (DUF982)
VNDPKWFDPPVSVKTQTIGRICQVNNVRAASEQMLGWPRRGPKWRNAIEICLAALDGRKTSADARKAFEAAAREAGVLIES